MKKILFTVFLFSIIIQASAQKVLVLENLTLGKSYKLYVGKKIKVMTIENPKQIKGRITEIQDSAIVISNNYVFNIDDIKILYKEQKAVYIISTSLLRFGAVFISLDVINNLINNDHPTFRENTAIISASTALTGFILWFFNYRKCRMENDKWRLKIIDQVHVRSK
jgi:hypothetical protein